MHGHADTSSGPDEATSVCSDLTVPSTQVVAIEHPCIVKNIDRAIQALGGEHLIKHVLSEDADGVTITTSLRPDDPFARKLVSKSADTQTLLLRFNVPRKTGRKRKRGSDDPYEFHEPASNGLPTGDTSNHNALPLKPLQVINRLVSCQGAYQVKPLGLVHRVHRFRGLPDFQFTAQDNPLTHQVARHLINPSLANIKQFDPPMKMQDVPDVLPAPPAFAAYDHQLYYGYAQNPLARQTQAGGQEEGVSLQVGLPPPTRRAQVALQHDVSKVPDGPPETLLPLSSATAAVQQAVKHIKAILKKRPIITRRAAMNLCPEMGEDNFKAATEYCGYAFKSGPWRDALVRFGVDPRTSPDYRTYQTLSFQISTKDKELVNAKKLASGSTQWLRSYKVARGRKSVRLGGRKGTKTGEGTAGSPSAPATPQRNERDASAATPTPTPNGGEQLEEEDDEVPSHIFDGLGLGTNTKTYQLLDITDPLLAPIVTSAPIRENVDAETWGWYTNGSLALIRVLMREKMGRLLSSQAEDGPSSIEELERLNGMLMRVVDAIPAVIEPRNVKETYSCDQRGLVEAEKKWLNGVLGNVRDLAKGDKAYFTRGQMGGVRRGAKWQAMINGESQGSGSQGVGAAAERDDDEEERGDEAQAGIGAAQPDVAGRVTVMDANEEGDDSNDEGGLADLAALEQR